MPSPWLPTTPGVLEEGLCIVTNRGPVDPGPRKKRDQNPTGGVHPVESILVAEAERNHIQSVLQHSAGVTEGPKGVARILGLYLNTLHHRMRKRGVGSPAPANRRSAYAKPLRRYRILWSSQQIFARGR